MSAYLTNKAHILISANQTPTQSEIDSQFAPSSMKPSVESLATEDSGRSDDGVMHIDWVLDRVRKLEIELRPNTPEEISKTLNKVLGREYWLTFWDLATNTEITRHMYTSNGSADWYSGIVRNGLLQNASFNAIELGGEKEGVVVNG